jgi:hypothetical protein
MRVIGASPSCWFSRMLMQEIILYCFDKFVFMAICIIPFGIPVFEKNIDTEEGRGLILYIDNKLDTTETHMGTNFQENLCVKIKLNQTDRLLVGLVYRSPSNRTSEYNDKLCSLLLLVKIPLLQVYICLVLVWLQ